MSATRFFFPMTRTSYLAARLSQASTIPKLPDNFLSCEPLVTRTTRSTKLPGFWATFSASGCSAVSGSATARSYASLLMCPASKAARYLASLRVVGAGGGGPCSCGGAACSFIHAGLLSTPLPRPMGGGGAPG